VSNPYREATRRAQANRRKHEGVWPGLLRGAVPIAAALLLVPLVRSLFLSFLDGPSEGWAAGTTQVLVRASILIIGLLSIDAFGAIIRGRDRAVLSILPVDPGLVVPHELARVAGERWWLIPAAALVLSPLAPVAPRLFLLGMVVLAGAWALGLSAGGVVHLLAIEVAESERWAPLLDMVRGHNPRQQAAFLYAPGAVLAVVGAAVVAASLAVAEVPPGGLPAGVWLGLPFLLAFGAWRAIPGLARRTWFHGSAVLAEIDGRYAALADAEEASRVYLDWAIRGLPAPVQRYALKDLRHGWRGRRSLVLAPWFLGLGALVAGWTSDPEGPARALVVALAGTWAVASVGVLMERDEPEFLLAWLPSGGVGRWVARAVVMALWLQPLVWPGALALAVFGGLDASAWYLGWASLSALGAIGLATAVGARRQGMWTYVPVATVAAAALGVAAV
jgi:hypothetical protein